MFTTISTARVNESSVWQIDCPLVQTWVARHIERVIIANNYRQTNCSSRSLFGREAFLAGARDRREDHFDRLLRREAAK